MTRPTFSRSHLALFVAALALCGCSTIENALSGDKVDYRSSGNQTAGLEVPPDLTQLARDSRYQPSSSGSVSAAAFQAAGPAAAPQQATTVAPQSVGDVHLERSGSERWLRTSMTPEQLWPQLRAFWKERGFVLTQDQPAAGVMETDWAENRAKLPQDFVRNTIGRVLEGLYSTGERDRFRTRIERAGNETDIFISHRGMVEVLTGQRREETIWQPRPSDPQLEAEFLARLMQKLGAKEEVATAAVAAAASSPTNARARVVAGRPAATLEVDDGFDRAWRRVGVALDRSGFTVEDRDRAQGLYYVRYVDPRQVGKEEPGFLSRIFSFGRRSDGPAPARYRVVVQGEGDRSTVTIQNAQGAPENGEAGTRISSLLLDELK